LNNEARSDGPLPFLRRLMIAEFRSRLAIAPTCET
jgi:hypothetical protein